MGTLCSLRALFDAVYAAVEMVKTFVIKLMACAIKEHMSLTQGDDALAVAQGIIHLMQRDYHGDAVVLVNVAQGFHHDARRFRVQGGDGLVGQNDFGFLHQRARNRHALLLSTGQGGDALVGEMRHADAGQRL